MPRKETKRSRARAGKRGAAQISVEPAAEPQGIAAISPEERRRMIAEAAYFRAERRGFALGGELDDWIEAEVEIDRLTQPGGSRSKHALRHM
jgi:hypothetical protein